MEIQSFREKIFWAILGLQQDGTQHASEKPMILLRNTDKNWIWLTKLLYNTLHQKEHCSKDVFSYEITTGYL